MRAETARKILEIWGYSDHLVRVDRRVQDAAGAMQAMLSREESRFQSVVQWVLFAVALLAVMDISLALVSAAYSGDGITPPGRYSGLGWFETIRAANADGFLLGALAVMLLALLVYWLIRNRARR